MRTELVVGGAMTITPHSLEPITVERMKNSRRGAVRLKIGDVIVTVPVEPESRPVGFNALVK